MKLSDAIRKRIKFYLKEKNMNVWKLCKMSGIPCSTISTFMSGKTDLIKLNTLLHICEGFDIILGEFFTDGIFDTAEQDKKIKKYDLIINLSLNRTFSIEIYQ